MKNAFRARTDLVTSQSSSRRIQT